MNAGTMFKRGAAVLGLLLLGALGGCSSLLPGKGASPDVFKLPSPGGAPASARTAKNNLQLVVDVPIAARALDTDRIAVRSDTYQLAYLSGARWDDNAPRVVQARLIEALEHSGFAAGVGRAEDAIRADFSLVSDLRNFEVVTQGLSAPIISVQIAAKLVVRPLGEVRAARVFDAQVKAAGRGKQDIIAAFDQALTAIGNDVAVWAPANLSPH